MQNEQRESKVRRNYIMVWWTLFLDNDNFNTVFNQQRLQRTTNDVSYRQDNDKNDL